MEHSSHWSGAIDAAPVLRVACKIFWIVAFAMLGSAPAFSLQLKKDTLTAWDNYIAQVSAAAKQRTLKNQTFLWIDQAPHCFEDIHSGAIAVEPAATHNPIRIASGLIHHWVAAIFIPDASVEDVLWITRDYAHYKDYYKPGVTEARMESQSSFEDKFTMRFSNSSLLSGTSLQGDFVSEFGKIDSNRWLTTSQTTSMCEIKNQMQMTPDMGSGYIWRIYNMARLENRGGGVILEMETIALSRDIPAALHWFVDPIVRRISRDSLEKSLTETSRAVRDYVQSRRDCDVSQCVHPMPDTHASR